MHSNLNPRIGCSSLYLGIAAHRACDCRKIQYSTSLTPACQPAARTAGYPAECRNIGQVLSLAKRTIVFDNSSSPVSRLGVYSPHAGCQNGNSAYKENGYGRLYIQSGVGQADRQASRENSNCDSGSGFS